MSLFDSFQEVKSKIIPDDPVVIDGFVFRLHYVYTVTLLLAFSGLLSLSQYAGDPIACRQLDGSSIDGSTFDRFCWVEGTYTKRYKPEMVDRVKSDLAAVACFEDDEDCWHHQYYQWVAIMLVFQAGCFYFPRYLWQIWEAGKIKSLIQGLDRRTLIRGLQTRDALTKGELNEKVKHLISYWRESKGSNNAWAVKYYICEFLNLVNVVLQFFLTNFFLDGQFNRIAWEGIHLEEHNSVLPILADCRLTLYGTGGSESQHPGLCVLPLNIVNQKFYTFFWFWLSFLQVCTCFSLTLRAIGVVSTEMRDFLLRYKFRVKEFNHAIVTGCNHGDWLLLTSVLENMNGIVNSVFIMELGDIKEFKIFDS